MTTVDHVLAACGRLRTSWAWLVDSTTPGRARPRNQRVLSPKQIERRNQRARDERNDVRALVNAGRIVGGGPAPADLGSVDAKTVIAGLVDELAAELSLAAGVLSDGLAPVGVHYTRNDSDNAKFTAAIDWISSRATRLNHRYHQPLIDHAYGILTRADRLARNITGDSGDRRRFAAPCPCCDRRSLVWDETSTEVSEWFVECAADSCRCRGTDCPCSIPGRHHGMTHLWTTQNWRTLAAKLEE